MDDRRFDVFLSYNSGDRAAVQRIAERLRAERLKPWWDRWALTPGGSWQEEILSGLQTSGACAVMVGPAGLGQWAREELMVAQDLAAKDRTFRIFMVLLPGAPTPSDPGLAFLSTRTWVDLRAGIAVADGVQDLIAAITGTPRRREAVAGGPDVSPYRGLQAFTEEHARYYFGREHDVAAVVERLAGTRFLAVLGSSGSGKSSVLGAGLLPAVRRGALAGSEGWAVRMFRPGARPLGALAAQMTHLFAAAPMQETLDRLRSDKRSLDLAASVAVADRPAEHRVLLVVDQFEELFTLCGDEEERKAFLDNLVYAATIPGGQVLVVVGMRADFYHRCAPYRDLRIHVSAQQFLVGPMDVDELRRAIEEPARQAGLEFEAGLVETILAEIHDPGTLPLLEDALFEVWQRRRGTMLTLDGYVASGGMQAALTQRADAVYDALTPVQQALVRRVLLRLVQPGDGAEDTRRRAEIGELRTGTDEDGVVDAVVGALADGRLVTVGTDDATGARVVEITHEALIRGWATLRSWIEDDRQVLVAERHLTAAASEWDRRGRAQDLLLTGAHVAYWKEHASGGLSELERSFVAESVAQESRVRAAERRRGRLVVGGVIAAIATVALVALWGLRSVSSERDIARSRQLAAESVTALRSDPTEGLRLAVSAIHLRPTREAQRALRLAAATPGSRSEILRGHDGIASSATFSPDGRRIVSAGEDGTVRVWDWAGRGKPVVLRVHESPVWTATFSPDGRLVASGGVDGVVRVQPWAGDGTPVLLRGHEGAVWSAPFSPDGRLVASAGSDGTVRVWDWAGAAAPVVLRGHRGIVYSAAFSPDGRLVASAAEDGTVRVWDWWGGGEPTVLTGHTGSVWGAAFSPDGRRIVSAGEDGTARVWEWPREGAGEPRVLRGSEEGVSSATFSPDGRLVVTAGGDRTVRVWDWAGSAQPVVLRANSGPVWTAAFQPGGGRLVVSAAADGAVRVWDWAAGRDPLVFHGHQGIVYSTAFSADGLRVVSGGKDGTVRVWDSVGGGELAVLQEIPRVVYSAAFSPGGRRVVSAGNDGTVRVVDWAAGGPTSVLRGHDGEVYNTTFSPDGRRVVSAGEDGTVRVWDTAGDEPPTVLRGHDGAVWGASFSPDGRWIVSGGNDGTVRLWDWAGGRPPIVLHGHDDAVHSAAFSADGSLVVSAGNDATVRVWRWEGGGKPVVLRGHVGAVWAAGFSPDGRQVVSAGDDSTVRVWDWRGGEEPAAFPGVGSSNGAAFSPDGKRVAGAQGDGAVRVWECSTCVPLADLLATATSKLS